ncbi:hydrogenase maturation protease [Nonomuraea sp. NPDC049714]|uniref:hydrogenase maturation protease n=1 Tax=Nonomuraea sp. NPDC049714 TaxID=3364357 RepID=UPI00378F99F9
MGDVFLGDDGFGVEVVRRLAGVRRAGVDVVDFGVRGGELAGALRRGYDLAVIVDAAVRGRVPGTITVVGVDQPRADLPGSDLPDWGGAGPARGVDPVGVLRRAAELGGVPDRVVVVCCEPAGVGAGVPEGSSGEELSAPVRAAVGPAVRLVLGIIAEGAGPEGAA